MEALETSHGGGIQADGTDDPWLGPIPERNKLGNLTGHEFLRCRYCSIEVIDGEEHNAEHKSQCPAREVSVDG